MVPRHSAGPQAPGPFLKSRNNLVLLYGLDQPRQKRSAAGKIGDDDGFMNGVGAFADAAESV